jgi:hypothetical protein
MTTATKSAKPVTRSARLMHLGDTLVLWLTTDRRITAYRIEAVPHDFGQTAFRLEKAHQGDGEPEVYEVLLDGQQSLCSCKGFLRHGMSKDGKGCRHIAGCQAAVNAGQLQAAPASKPAPKPEAKPAPQVQAEAKPATEHTYYCPECRTHYTGACCNCSI